MKRVFCLLSIMVSIVMPSFSQVQFGYLSYSTVKKQMPEYTQAQNNMAALRTKYEQEAQRGEDEFQKKFVEFLQGQKEFPTTILQKRQAELQNLMDNGLSFRNQAQGLLADAEKEARRNKLGLWIQPNPMEPREYRRSNNHQMVPVDRTKIKIEGPFWVSKSGKIHNKYCEIWNKVKDKTLTNFPVGENCKACGGAGKRN